MHSPARPPSAFGRLTAGLALILSAATIGVMTGSASADTPAPVGIANPASVACVTNGGRSEIRTLSDGGQVGYCHLADGRICEEWALFRDGRCVTPPMGIAPQPAPR